jgi:hypothetical protein
MGIYASATHLMRHYPLYRIKRVGKCAYKHTGKLSVLRVGSRLGFIDSGRKRRVVYSINVLFVKALQQYAFPLSHLSIKSQIFAKIRPSHDP